MEQLTKNIQQWSIDKGLDKAEEFDEDKEY